VNGESRSYNFALDSEQCSGRHTSENGNEHYSSVKGRKPHYISGIVVFARTVFGVVEYATYQYRLGLSVIP
jgi:hypothetical protein